MYCYPCTASLHCYPCTDILVLLLLCCYFVLLSLYCYLVLLSLYCYPCTGTLYCYPCTAIFVLLSLYCYLVPLSLYYYPCIATLYCYPCADTLYCYPCTVILVLLTCTAILVLIPCTAILVLIPCTAILVLIPCTAILALRLIYPSGPTDDDVTVAPTKKEDGAPSMLAFYIVMPFFFLCYGGSCFVYCMHKIYHQCRRQHRHRIAVGNTDNAQTSPPKDPPPSWVWAPPPSIASGKYKARDTPWDTSSPSPSQHNTNELCKARQLIVTTTEENETTESRALARKTHQRMHSRKTGSAESLTEIHIREGTVSTQRAERKRRREDALKSRLLPIDDAMELKKEFVKERRTSKKILVA